MDNYRLYNVVRPLLEFLENLTNWYVRLNRTRMKGDEGVDAVDQFTALNTLFDVLLNATQLLSPITPFLSEHIYQNLRNGMVVDCSSNKESIHFTSIPDFSSELLNEDIENAVKRMQNAIETGRLIRDKVNISMKYPLRTVQLVEADKKILSSFSILEKYIKEELNCLELSLSEREDDFVTYKADPENRLMG